MSLVERINELCVENGTTFAALERALGFGQGSIRKWGSSSPSVDKLQKAAKYFDVSVDYLLGREPSDETGAMLEFLHKNPDMKVLLSSSAKLQKEDLDAVITIVQSMNRERDNDD